MNMNSTKNNVKYATESEHTDVLQERTCNMHLLQLGRRPEQVGWEESRQSQWTGHLQQASWHLV